VNVPLVAGCGIVGLGVGALLPVAVERVPARRRVLQPPYPEVAAGARSWQGQAMAVVTGALFGAMAARIGLDADLPAYLVLAAALVLLTVIDLRHFLLPNRIVYALAVVSILLLGIAAVVESAGDAWLRAVACAIGMLLVFGVLHVISPRGMGFGDVKLSFALGLDLGWLGVGETVLGGVLAFVYGAVVGILLLATGIRSRTDHVPFGPFLAAGALTAVLAGHAIIDWYTG
jgi:leader peptidase (prepilin peptidase)/N-methyltransferase